MQPKEIKDLIESKLKDCTALIQGDDGAHFQATVISPEFSGKSRVQKQQLVYTALHEQLISGRLHALSLKTFTPDEWQNLTSENRGKL